MEHNRRGKLAYSLSSSSSEKTHTQEYKRSINKDKHRADGRMVMVLT